MGRAKTALGSRACFPSGISGWFIHRRGGCRRIWRGEVLVSAARCCSIGSGRLGGAVAAGRTMERAPEFGFIDFRPPHYPLLSPSRAREGQAVVCRLIRGSSPTRWVAPKQHWAPALTASVTLARARGPGRG